MRFDRCFPRRPRPGRFYSGGDVAVASSGGAASNADRHTLIAAGRFIFGLQRTLDPDALSSVTPEGLRAALAGSDLATTPCAS